MMAHPLALQLRNLQSLVEIGVDQNTTVVFPAPLMSTIQELGAFLAREQAAGTTPTQAPTTPPPMLRQLRRLLHTARRGAVGDRGGLQHRLQRSAGYLSWLRPDQAAEGLGSTPVLRCPALHARFGAPPLESQQLSREGCIGQP